MGASCGCRCRRAVHPPPDEELRAPVKGTMPCIPCYPHVIPDPAGGFLRRVPFSPTYDGVQIPAAARSCSPSQTGLVWRRFFLTPDLEDL